MAGEVIDAGPHVQAERADAIRMESGARSRAGTARFLPAAVFILTFCALMIPHELAVRQSERMYGVDRVGFATMMDDNAKLDFFLNELHDGQRFSMYCVGTSVCEYALHPDVLQTSLPKDRHGVYNLGFSGTSLLCGLKILRLLDIHPDSLVVSVSPFDFTVTAAARGDKILQHATDSARSLGLNVNATPPPFDVRTALEGWTRNRFYGLLHSATPARRRTLPQWLMLLKSWRVGEYQRGDLLRFLNNEVYRFDFKAWDSYRYYVEFCKHGYLGLKLKWLLPLPEFERTQFKEVDASMRTKTLPEYQKDGLTYREQAFEVLRGFRERGTRIVLVRIPEYHKLIETENESGFDNDMHILASRLGVRYISQDIVPAEFMTNPDNFRDAEHLHYDSSLVYGKILVYALRSVW